MPSLASSAISAAISEYRALTCHTRWTRRRGLDSCGTRVHTIPEPLATSIAAARAITSAGSSDTPAGSPVSPGPPIPAGSLPFFLAIAGPTFPVGADTVRLPAGRRRGKLNLIGVHAATLPSPHRRPGARLITGHEAPRTKR